MKEDNSRYIELVVDQELYSSYSYELVMIYDENIF